MNGLPAIIADSLDSFNSISKIFNISIENLKKYNDMDDNQKIENGNIYYLKRKRKKARVFTYNPRVYDTLWNVSQKFGIRLACPLCLVCPAEHPEMGFSTPLAA